MLPASKAVRVFLNRWPDSMRALARAADVPVSTLSRIKNGERDATIEVAERVAYALERYAIITSREAAKIRKALSAESEK